MNCGDTLRFLICQPFSKGLVCLVLGAALAAEAMAADWLCWRGPDGLGVSAEENLPVRWGKDDNLAWKFSVPGKGASSPIIAGDCVYLTTQTEDLGLHVLAIHRVRGELLWDRELARRKVHANDLHNMATPTPVTDGKRIWAMFGTGDLACLDKDGKIVWQRDLAVDYGKLKTLHGYGSSPTLDDGRLFILCMHQGPSYVLAIDAATGKDIWRKERNMRTKDEAQDSYSSPIFLRSAGRTQMVIEGAESVSSYNPATGDLFWSLGGLKVQHPYGRTIAGLAAGDNVLVVVASGFQNRGYTVALNPDLNAAGDRKLWTQAKYSPDCPTPVVYQGHVFLLRDDGNASCLDLKTGEPRWQERIFSVDVKVSPVAGDGKVYFTSGQGNCIVVKASPKFEPLATNVLNEPTLSTPAVSHGQLFVRTLGALRCVAAPR